MGSQRDGNFSRQPHFQTEMGNRRRNGLDLISNMHDVLTGQFFLILAGRLQSISVHRNGVIAFCGDGPITAPQLQVSRPQSASEGGRS
jgi:hypothetical protein